MTPQEREVIDSIFERLKPAASQPRDPEAERHIAELMKQQPYATYVLAQSAYVQEQALTNLSQENEQLKARLDDAERRAAQPAQQGGFLSSLFGGGPAPARPQPRPQFAPQGQPQPQGGAQGGPWGQQPGGMGQGGMGQGGPWGGAAQQQPQRGGSGFLGTALTTAAGVAGGMVVGNMLMNAFKGDSSGAGAGANAQSASATGGEAGPQSNEAMSANNYADEGSRYDEPQDAGYDDYDGGGDSYDA